MIFPANVELHCEKCPARVIIWCTTRADLCAGARLLGWTVYTLAIETGNRRSYYALDYCPTCAPRHPADGGAPSTTKAEPVGHDSGRTSSAATPGTFPVPPPTAPVGGDPCPVPVVTPFFTAAGAPGIGPAGCQPPTFYERLAAPVLDDPWEFES